MNTRCPLPRSAQRTLRLHSGLRGTVTGAPRSQHRDHGHGHTEGHHGYNDRAHGTHLLSMESVVGVVIE